jgi:hypothetical protein
MSDDHDALELELSGLRPQAISPELKQRIAEQLAATPVVRTRRPWRWVLAGGLATAACIAAMLLWPDQEPDRVPPIAAVRQNQGDQIDDSRPTLQAYQRVLANSADGLDALLNRHAAATLLADPLHPRTRAFNLTDGELHRLTGEL